MKLWSLWDMIYQFKAGSLVATISALEIEMSHIMFRRNFSDYDWDKHRPNLLKTVRVLRSGLQYMPHSAVLESLFDRFEERLEILEED